MNRVTLIGRLTKDITLEQTKGGMSVVVFNIAVDRTGKEGADFPRCKAFGKVAENMAKYCGKGSLLAVEGRLETGSYDKGTEKVYYTEVISDRVEFLSWKSEESEY